MVSKSQPILKLVRVDVMDKYSLKTTTVYFNPHEVATISDMSFDDDRYRYLFNIPSYAASKVTLKNGDFLYSPKTVEEISKEIHEAANSFRDSTEPA